MPGVPFTLQFFFMVLAGVLLGAKGGALSQIIYIGVGLMGLPVFTKGGGIYYILEPTFGYLIGFIVAAYGIGRGVERLKKIKLSYLLGLSLLGLLIVYSLGVCYMLIVYRFYLQTPLSVQMAIWTGAILCAPGDLISCLLAALLTIRLVPILKT
jgi:biotin transport system substrate-specific component